jgi:hypothetical protein
MNYYPEKMTKLVVILGCSIKSDKGAFNIPPILLSRLQKCLKIVSELKKKGEKFVVITTGGGTFKYTGNSESSVMKNWLIKNGVSQNLIIEENQSMNTYENALYTSKLLLFYRQHPTYDCITDDSYEESDNDIISFSSIVEGILVTSDFHIERSKFLFGKFIPDIKFEYIGSDTHISEKESRMKYERLVLDYLKSL